MSVFLAGLTSALDRRNQLRGRLHEFDAVAERIRHGDAVEPLERLVVVDGEAGSDGSGRQTVHVVDDERWVRLGRWLEAGIDTEVYLQVSVFEPAATANGEVTGFRNMRDAEHSFVERDSLGLESGRHRQLHMIESNDAHATHSAPRLRPCRQANIGCTAWAGLCGSVLRSGRLSIGFIECAQPALRQQRAVALDIAGSTLSASRRVALCCDRTQR